MRVMSAFEDCINNLQKLNTVILTNPSCPIVYNRFLEFVANYEEANYLLTKVEEDVRLKRELLESFWEVKSERS
jgi:RAB protein geranylgeranyltransferase component A